MRRRRCRWPARRRSPSQTDGVAPNSGDAVKTYVDANIQITPATATNPVSTNHTLTGHVNVNDGQGGGYVNAPNGTQITFALQNSGGASASFVGRNSCLTTGGTGSCTVVISSSTTGDDDDQCDHDGLGRRRLAHAHDGRRQGRRQRRRGRHLDRSRPAADLHADGHDRRAAEADPDHRAGHRRAGRDRRHRQHERGYGRPRPSRPVRRARSWSSRPRSIRRWEHTSP